MKAVLHLFFVLFYVTSASAASQIKTVDLIEKVQHANSRSDGPTIDRARSKEVGNLPRYREAKKAPSDSQRQAIWNIDLTPTEAKILALHDLSHRLRFRLPPSHSRAPPTLA